MMANPASTPAAFITIGALAKELELPQHTLRYWETRFPQLKPMQRAGNRRYYRPDDVELAHIINRLLNQEGYTFRGVQQILAGGNVATAEREPVAMAAPSPSILPQLVAIRDRLVAALAADAA